jgi:hypothetical protein
MLTTDKLCISVLVSVSEPFIGLDKFLKPCPLLAYNASPNSSPTADRKLFGSLKFALVKVINKSAISA